jgi:hypothetical protein
LTHKKQKAVKVYKDTIEKSVSNYIPLDADLGYLGIEACHWNSFIPVKASKKRWLTEEEKAYNKELARRSVVIEHINGRIKYSNICHTLIGVTAATGIH